MFSARIPFWTQPPSGFGNNIILPGNINQNLYISSPTTNIVNWKATTGFTLEYWFYYTADVVGSGPSGFGNQDPSGALTTYWNFGTTSDRRVQFIYRLGVGSSNTVTTTSNILSLNVWNNIALVCTTVSSTTNINIYVNGTSQASLTGETGGGSSTGTPFGMGGSPGPYGTGFMNNIQISNTARYSGASYTLPTTSFYPDIYTQLLIIPTESSGSTITYQNTGAGGTMTNTSNLITATTTRANHT
jgi:hypothetical protein